MGEAIAKARDWASQQDDAEWLLKDLEPPFNVAKFNDRWRHDWTEYPFMENLRNCIIAVNRCELEILKSYGR